MTIVSHGQLALTHSPLKPKLVVISLYVVIVAPICKVQACMALSVGEFDWIPLALIGVVSAGTYY